MKSAIGPLMLDVEGLELTGEDQQLLANPHVGGIILFARNYDSPTQLTGLVKQIRQCNECVVIAVDQEGGRVQRFKNGFTKLPAMNVFSRLWEENQTYAIESAGLCGWLMASELLSYGIDISFAPVLDIKTGINPMIGDRAFSHDTEVLIKLAKAFMEGMHEAGMATTGKHFPGHGSVAADSHFESPVDDRSMSEIRAMDLKPFSVLVAELDAVMPAHITYPQVDPHCAGFSSYWLQTILREELGFDGVIFSDDLVMSGAQVAGGIKTKVKAALQAGCDMVLVCNDRQIALEALQTLEQDELLLSPRLHKMRARRKFSAQELKESDKWQQAQNRVDSISAG